MNHPKQIDRRRLRSTLGSRTTRRQGTKSKISRRARPVVAMRKMVSRINSGSATMDDFAS